MGYVIGLLAVYVILRYGSWQEITGVIVGAIIGTAIIKLVIEPTMEWLESR